MEKQKNINKYFILSLIALVVLLCLEFIYHRFMVFMMDDIWYSTNLATGAPLSGISDVIESQVWHYLNWGGRSVTHSILQLVIMTGNLSADIINMIMFALLSYLICIMAKSKNLYTYVGVSSMLIFANPNIKMSMFWEAGCVNYVFSSCWILTFVYLYIKVLRDYLEDKECALCKGGVNALITVLMIPLSIITGWSNENMGPASTVLAIGIILYIIIKFKKKAPLWMYIGAAGGAIGSAVMILAPGNFVRVDTIEKVSLAVTIRERIISMLTGYGAYLFPITVIMVLLILIYVIVLKQKPDISHIALILYMLISYLAMMLSPHYPDRASFGTMVIGIVISADLIKQISDYKNLKERGLMYPYLLVFAGAVWKLIYEIYLFV